MNPKPKVPDDIKELIGLVRAGKLFAVQKWIAEGKRIMPPRPYRNSPIDAAVEIGFHSMVEVLLEAGIDQMARDDLLGEAVWRGNFDMIKLFVEHGANIHAISFEEVCDTVNPEIMRYFLDRGIDAVTGQPFAHALEEPKRPFLGVFLDYKNKIPELKNQLNQALRFHSGEGRLRWVCLLLWAGADPRVAVPRIGDDPDPDIDSSALEEAVEEGHIEIVNKIGLDPKRDNLDQLLAKACSSTNWSMIEKLLDLGANPVDNQENDTMPMACLIHELVWKIEPLFHSRRDWEVEEILKTITKFADQGGRWQPRDNYGVNRLRRALYRLDPGQVERIIKSFHDHKVCARDVFLKLISTPRMKQKLGGSFDKLKKEL